MRFAVVYESDARRWAVIDSLMSDEPLTYFATEWDAVTKAHEEERLWRTQETPRPRSNAVAPSRQA